MPQTTPKPAPKPSSKVLADSATRDTQRLVQVLSHHGVDHILDIGANTGQFGQRLRQGGYAGAITSLEPIPAVRDQLAKTVAADPDWEILPAQAVGAEVGEAVLTIAGATDMSSLAPLSRKASHMLEDGRAVEQITVTVQTLDEAVPGWVPETACPALKIDTQGTELDVLRGAGRVIDRFRVLVVELSLIPLYEGEAEWRTVMDAIAALGFEPVLFLPGYFNRATARQVGMDGVFVRRDCLDMRLG